MKLTEMLAQVLSVAAMIAGFVLGIARHQYFWSGVCFLCSGLLQIIAGGHFTVGILFGLFVMFSTLRFRIPFWVTGGLMGVVALDEFRQLAKLVLRLTRDEGEQASFLRGETDLSVRLWTHLREKRQSDAGASNTPSDRTRKPRRSMARSRESE